MNPGTLETPLHLGRTTCVVGQSNWYRPQKWIDTNRLHKLTAQTPWVIMGPCVGSMFDPACLVEVC